VNVKSKTLKIRNLPQGKKRLACINSKPYLFIVMFLSFGAYAIWKGYYVVGAIILAVFLFNLFCIPNKVVTEFYEEYAVYYYEQEKDECFILFWEDIASWIYYPKMNDLDLIEIELKDHARICFKCLSKHKTMQYFQMFAPNKEKTKAKVRIL
jgi:hypothetical protein